MAEQQTRPLASGASPASAVPGPGERHPPPRLPGSYWRLWGAAGISNLGDGIAFVAVGLLTLTLTDDERLLAVATVMTFAAWFVIALPVGVVIDRFDRKRLMVGANLVRVATYGAIAVLAVEARLSIWGLLGLLAVAGACEVVFDSTGQALIPHVVPPQQLARANGYFFTAEVIAGSVAGLALGGVLFDVDIGLPFATNAIGYAVGAVLLVTLGLRAAPAADLAEPGDSGIRSSLRWLWRHRLLRNLAWLTAVAALGLMFGMGVVAKFAIDDLGLSNAEFGVLMAINAMGGATGGLVGPRLIERFSTRAVLGLSYLFVAAALIVVGTVPPAWVVGVAFFCSGSVISVWNIATLTLRQQLIPSQQFGRVNAVYRWLSAISNVIGILAGGFLAYTTNLGAPFLAGGLTMVAAGVVVARPLVRGLADLD